jgi:hypothetical protein
MLDGHKLSTLYDLWVKNIIEPSHIISYLDKFNYTLGYITLNEIKVISKDKKIKWIWKTPEKNNTQI